MLKRLCACFLAVSMASGLTGGSIFMADEKTAGVSRTADFDPETVMWTDNTIESVLAEGEYIKTQPR